MLAYWLEGSSRGSKVVLPSTGVLEAGSTPHTHETNSWWEKDKEHSKLNVLWTKKGAN